MYSDNEFGSNPKCMPFNNLINTSLLLLIKPLTNRVKLGEGGLLVLNVIQLIPQGKPIPLFLLECALSFLVLCVLYGYNDYTDAEHDRINPKKELSFVELILANRPLFYHLIVFVQLATIMLYFIFKGWQIAFCLVLLYLINFLYSKKVKQMPFADIVIVAVWGGLYLSLAAHFQWALIFVSAVMTGIAHFFQVHTDKDADTLNQVTTSAVAFPAWDKWQLLVLCSFLAAGVYLIAGYWLLSLLSFLPFLFYLVSRKIVVSWHLSRLTCFIIWLIILKGIYAGV